MHSKWHATFTLQRRSEALTPKLFIDQNVWQSLSKVFDTSPHKYRSKWKSVYKAANLFWERFLKEYVPSLQRCQKLLQ